MPQLGSNQILLTFTGFHDPYSETPVDGEREAGPVLTVAAERHFDRVYLFSTPNTADLSIQTKQELIKRHTGLEVAICEVPLKDPTNYLGILRQLRSHFRTVSQANPQGEYSICVTSGTPHMHASWLMLAASGEIPARILQTRATRFVREGQSQVTEIDFTNPEFPTIRPFGRLVVAGEDNTFSALCAELQIVGSDGLFLRELKKAFTLAEYDSPVLLCGETGVGKEVFARVIHRASDRASKPLVVVNCAAFTENLIESQLFGHRKGAFTGAHQDRRGCFEEADGGMLFLDELGEMPPSCQAKLLRALQHGKIQRLGDSKESNVNVRLVAATNIVLRQAVQEKRFRKDLYYRFDAVISIPPLRERRDDIPKLVQHFMEQWNLRHQKSLRFSQEAVLKMLRYPWPGNVRELESVVRRSAQLSSGKVIDAGDLMFDEILGATGVDTLPEPQEGFDLNGFLSEIRGRLIDKAMTRCAGNRTAAAKLLGITPQAVSQYLRKRK